MLEPARAPAILVADHHRLRQRVAGRRHRRDRRRIRPRIAHRQPGFGGIFLGHRRPRQEGLDAAGSAAVARRPGPLLVTRPRQRVVAPLAGDRVRARHEPLVDDDAAAGSGADDHAEHRRRTGRCAVGGLREREAIGVVRDPHRPAERRAQIGAEAPAVEPRRVGVLDQSGRRRDRAGHADADRAPARHVPFEARHQPGNGSHGIVVTVTRRCHPLARRSGAWREASHRFGAAQVEPIRGFRRNLMVSTASSYHRIRGYPLQRLADPDQRADDPGRTGQSGADRDRPRSLRGLRRRPHRRRRPRARPGRAPRRRHVARAGHARGAPQRDPAERHTRPRRRGGVAPLPRPARRRRPRLPVPDRPAPDRVRQAVRMVGARSDRPRSHARRRRRLRRCRTSDLHRRRSEEKSTTLSRSPR